MVIGIDINKIKTLIEQHHKIYRFPVKAELWEDIFDQSLNGWDSSWTGGGHSTGADVISENGDNTGYQNKGGEINFNTNTIKWNGHRTTSHKTIEEKVDFISKPHYDKYVMLGRVKRDWDNDIKRYYLINFDSKLIQYDKLNWVEKLGVRGKNKGKVVGWVGSNVNLPYTAEINISQSHQLWTTCDLDYLGKIEEILID